MVLNKVQRMQKIDPYEPCPCGTNEKFKFCCYQKARNSRGSTNIYKEYTDSRIHHEATKRWDDTDFKVCLGFSLEECNPLIKGAHAIQNNKILNRISENGHVYTFIGKVSKKGIDAEFNLVSKNKASTFFGFCDFHDTELFKPIELIDYKQNPLQNFLFSFRGFCLEYHRKIRKMKTTRENLKKNPVFMLDPFSISLYRVAEFDIADGRVEYDTFKEDFINGDFVNLVTIQRSLDYEVEFAVSSAFAVEHDLLDNQINDIYSVDSELIPNIYINIFPVENKTHIILSYHKKYENVYNNYFEQISALTDSEMEKYLNFLVINYTENVFFSPRLIDSMSDQQKDSLLKSFESSVKLNKKLELMIDDQFFKFNLFKNTIKSNS